MNNQQEKTLLPNETIRQLKKMAHHLKPVVLVGKKGPSPALIKEIDVALTSHELIKIKISSKMKETLPTDLEEILRETGAQHIDTIGNIVILFRKNEDSTEQLKKIEMS